MSQPPYNLRMAVSKHQNSFPKDRLRLHVDIPSSAEILALRREVGRARNVPLFHAIRHRTKKGESNASL
jgi:hypothetical protein